MRIKKKQFFPLVLSMTLSSFTTQIILPTFYLLPNACYNTSAVTAIVNEWQQMNFNKTCWVAHRKNERHLACPSDLVSWNVYISVVCVCKSLKDKFIDFLRTISVNSKNVLFNCDINDFLFRFHSFGSLFGLSYTHI